MERELGRALYPRSLIIRTPLDAELQAAAEAELGKQLDAVESGRFGEYDHPAYGRRTAAGDSTRQGSSYLQGAVVAMDASTGDVLTMVGGRNFDHSRFNRATLARRQPASTFKPFLLAAALSSGWATDPWSGARGAATRGRRATSSDGTRIRSASAMR